MGNLTTQSLRVISLGGPVCTLGAVLFFLNYPGGRARGVSDIARPTVGVYGVGIVVLGGAAWPPVTPRRAGR